MSRISVTSAMPGLARPSRRRSRPPSACRARLLGLMSPSTHLMASTTLLLPQPLGPTMAVMPSPKSNDRAVGERLEALDLEAADLHGRVVRSGSARGLPNRGSGEGPDLARRPVGRTKVRARPLAPEPRRRRTSRGPLQRSEGRGDSASRTTADRRGQDGRPLRAPTEGCAAALLDLGYDAARGPPVLDDRRIGRRSRAPRSRSSSAGLRSASIRCACPDERWARRGDPVGGLERTPGPSAAPEVGRRVASPHQPAAVSKRAASVTAKRARPRPRAPRRRPRGSSRAPPPRARAPGRIASARAAAIRSARSRRCGARSAAARSAPTGSIRCVGPLQVEQGDVAPAERVEGPVRDPRPSPKEGAPRRPPRRGPGARAGRPPRRRPRGPAPARKAAATRFTRRGRRGCHVAVVESQRVGGLLRTDLSQRLPRAGRPASSSTRRGSPASAAAGESLAWSRARAAASRAPPRGRTTVRTGSRSPRPSRRRSGTGGEERPRRRGGPRRRSRRTAGPGGAGAGTGRRARRSGTSPARTNSSRRSPPRRGKETNAGDRRSSRTSCVRASSSEPGHERREEDVDVLEGEDAPGERRVVATTTSESAPESRRGPPDRGGPLAPECRASSASSESAMDGRRGARRGRRGGGRRRGAPPRPPAGTTSSSTYWPKQVLAEASARDCRVAAPRAVEAAAVVGQAPPEVVLRQADGPLPLSRRDVAAVEELGVHEGADERRRQTGGGRSRGSSPRRRARPPRPSAAVEARLVRRGRRRCGPSTSATRRRPSRCRRAGRARSPPSSSTTRRSGRRAGGRDRG